MGQQWQSLLVLTPHRHAIGKMRKMALRTWKVSVQDGNNHATCLLEGVYQWMFRGNMANHWLESHGAWTACESYPRSSQVQWELGCHLAKRHGWGIEYYSPQHIQDSLHRNQPATLACRMLFPSRILSIARLRVLILVLISGVAWLST